MFLINFSSKNRSFRRIFTIMSTNLSEFNAACNGNNGFTCKEIEIPVPWGKIAAKFWNSNENKRPILLAHGWKDNAGSFDTLVPLLPKTFNYLAFDFPGHGYSSRKPAGTYYQITDAIIVYRMIAHYFKWDKISIIGHSMGAITAFLFSSLFPDKVDFYVALDALKPPSKFPGSFIKETANNIDKFVNLLNKEPFDNMSTIPKYTFDDLCEKYHEASYNSVDLSKCHYLVERVKKSHKNQPNLFYFDLDARVKLGPLIGMMHDDLLEYAKQITCPILVIKAKQNGYYEDKKNYYEVLNILQRGSEHCCYLEVDGTHHVHLNNPERVAKNISDFILEFYRS